MPEQKEKHPVRDSAAIAAAVAAMLDDFRREIEGMVDDYFPRAAELGMRAADEIVRRARVLSPRAAEKFISEQIAAERTYIEGWMADVKAAVNKALDGRYADEAEAIGAITGAFDSQAYRTGNYGAAIWRVAHLGAKEEMSAQVPAVEEDGGEVEAWFTAFPEADVIETSCEGCIEAVAGNPYTPESCPVPGEFECLFNCRHYVEYRVVARAEGRSAGGARQLSGEGERTIVKDHPKCPVSKPWGLISKHGGTLLGCHATEEEAKKQEAAIQANKGK